MINDDILNYYFDLEKEYRKLKKHYKNEKEKTTDIHEDYYDSIYDSSLTKNENKQLYKDAWKEKMGLYQ